MMTVQDSLIEKIAELYREFQRTLRGASHDHLQASEAFMAEIDAARQEQLRKQIGA